jgi:hypothetical protein
MDLIEKAREVSKELENLPHGNALHIASLFRRDLHMFEGRVFLVPRKKAAMHIVNGTHALASPEQISNYESEMRNRQIEVMKLIREEQQKFQIMLTPDLIAASASFMQQANQQTASVQPEPIPPAIPPTANLQQEKGKR